MGKLTVASVGGTTDLGASEDSQWVRTVILLSTGIVTSVYHCLAYTRRSELVTRFQEETLRVDALRMERSWKKDR